MSYFTTDKIFLFPSFDLPEKEKTKLNIFLSILEDSQVGPLIHNAIKNILKLVANLIIHIGYLLLSFMDLQNIQEVLEK